MSANSTQRQPPRPAELAVSAPTNDPELEALISQYLDGEYRSASVAADLACPEVVRLHVDDITAMRTAKRIAEQLRAQPVRESSGDGGLAQRTQVVGLVLRHLVLDILSLTRTALEVPEAATVGPFALLLVESFLARVRLGVQPGSIVLPAHWPTSDQQAFLQSAERLWRCGEVIGLTNPDMDSASVEHAVEVMAAWYTAAYFARMDASQIDALALGTSFATLQRRVLGCIKRVS